MRAGRIIKCQQGDAEWLHERCGRVTASRVAEVLAIKRDGKPSEKRQSYMMELLTEILTGHAAEHFVSPAMDWGITQECVARGVYEMVKDVEVERVGMFIHPSIDRASASPDGLVGCDGLVEFKCPTTATHLKYIMEGILPPEYIPQLSWQLACTGRSYCDFVSFDSRLPEEFGLLIVRLERDDAVIADMEAKVEQFIAELNAMSEKLLAHRRPIAKPVRVDNSDVLPRAVIPEMA